MTKISEDLIKVTGCELEIRTRIDDFTLTMELQDHTKNYWNHYFCHQPQVDAGVSHPLLSSVQLEEHLDPYCNIWTDCETVRAEKHHGRSFALDARIRLDSLKSGCESPSPCCGMNIKLYKYNSEKDLWDGEDFQTEQSALDLVEILDLEDYVQDEESWLYEPVNKQSFVGKESALRWCRRVLDNPEMEAARHVLRHKLDQKLRYEFYRPGKTFYDSPSGTETSVSTSPRNPETSDHNELNDSITSYKLQDITDVHIMARIQEDNLRREYVSTPAAAVPCRRDPEMIPAYLNTNVDDDLGPENKTKSSCASTSPSASSSCCKSPTSAPKQSCQSPKLSRLHQQVTQFKLLRLAQNQGASPCRTRSPLRTSLRSLQAVRNSRSLETDDHQTAGQITCPPSGVSTTTVPSCGSPLLSAASLNSSNRGMSARITAMKKLQRSQSLSPSRMAHPARGFLSAQGRVFASPERPTTAAWGRHVSSVQR